jgi:hypothetical protein
MSLNEMEHDTALMSDQTISRFCEYSQQFTDRHTCNNPNDASIRFTALSSPVVTFYTASFNAAAAAAMALQPISSLSLLYALPPGL